MNKVYIITGATSGIGKQLVEKFSQDDSNIVFAGYRSSRKLPAEFKSNIKYFYIDMRNSDTIKDAANYIKSQIPHIDTIVNAAGCVVAGPVEKIDIERIKEQFNVNTFSHLEFCQNLTDILFNSKIINISSVASFGIFPFISPYCASKRALDILFNAFCIENHKNIKVISVKPGVIPTPLWEKSIDANIQYLENDKDYEKELNFIKDNAVKNETRGLNIQKVVKLIEKIDKSKHPHTSYTIGVDSKAGQFLSLFPQGVVNNAVKIGMKLRMKK